MSNFINQNYLEANFSRPVTLLNAGFDSWQRGTSLSIAEIVAFSGYCADQWILTVPGSQTATVSRAADFVTSNRFSHRCLSIALSSATSSLSANTQFGLAQKIEGIYARDLLLRPLTFSGKVKTNKAGIYSAYISWTDTGSSNITYCVIPISLLGDEGEESFTVTFPPCPTTFVPQTGEGVAVEIGIILAGTASTVTGVYLAEAASAKTFCHASQVNFFDTSSNYIRFSQFTLTPGLVARKYFSESLDRNLGLCRRYIERVVLSSHLVNLYAGTTSHIGSLSYATKLSGTPALTFLQTDESKTSISNSGAVYYTGGSTNFTLSTFAAAGRTTSRSSGFSFTTASSIASGIATGNINLDVLVTASL